MDQSLDMDHIDSDSLAIRNTVCRQGGTDGCLVAQRKDEAGSQEQPKEHMRTTCNDVAVSHHRPP